ncbi:unnamed protein product [Dimorphilus gyrociliatus]|uniref:EF-hand domain-containing protein n=1 Tax=Dimorphilus gyrociliatus TaxID=2664684 RepID=A0A7I8VW72_9ANNE|nr:unnamed protein product [Dimorphilus gyrociliatus]
MEKNIPGLSTSDKKPSLDSVDSKTCLWLFKEIDKDKNGYIDTNELGDAMNRLMTITDVDVKVMMDYADKNKDHRLSFPEFKGVIEDIKQIRSKKDR